MLPYKLGEATLKKFSAPVLPTVAVLRTEGILSALLVASDRACKRCWLPGRAS